MKFPIIVIDDFFETPTLVRDFALQQTYSAKDNATGFRTDSFHELNSTQNFNKFIINKVISFTSPIDGIGADKINCDYMFQFSPGIWEIGTSFHIHKDDEFGGPSSHYTCIVYLHPDPPDGKGTAFYRLDPTKLESYDIFCKTKMQEMLKYKTLMCSDIYGISDKDREIAKNLILEHDSHFLMTDYVGNKFNRCLLWPTDLWHDGFGYFGNDVHDSRLILIGFVHITDDKLIPSISRKPTY
jgi:hypothetical protein